MEIKSTWQNGQKWVRFSESSRVARFASENSRPFHCDSWNLENTDSILIYNCEVASKFYIFLLHAPIKQLSARCNDYNRKMRLRLCLKTFTTAKNSTLASLKHTKNRKLLTDHWWAPRRWDTKWLSEVEFLWRPREPWPFRLPSPWFPLVEERRILAECKDSCWRLKSACHLSLTLLNRTFYVDTSFWHTNVVFDLRKKQTPEGFFNSCQSKSKKTLTPMLHSIMMNAWMRFILTLS